MNEQFDQYVTALEEIARSMSADEVDFRAPVPAGTPLGVTEIEPGATAMWTKRSSGQRMGSKELPDRVPLYNLKTGDKSMVPPTIATSRIMSRPGEFSMRAPTDIPPRIPIDETCEVCMISRNGVPRPFYSEYDLEAHKQILHPREWALEERRREEGKRREDRQAQSDLVAAVLEAVRGDEAPRRGRKAAE